MLVEVGPVMYARTAISTGSGARRCTPSVGIGDADDVVLRDRSGLLNHHDARRFSTCPLNGMVPSARSNALMRSVTTMNLGHSRVIVADLALVTLAKTREVVPSSVCSALRREGRCRGPRQRLWLRSLTSTAILRQPSSSLRRSRRARRARCRKLVVRDAGRRQELVLPRARFRAERHAYSVSPRGSARPTRSTSGPLSSLVVRQLICSRMSFSAGRSRG